jgi:hypothetical protein
MDGDDMIRKLAQSVDNMIQAGSATIPIVAVNAPLSVAVTFPVAYSTIPVVVATPVTNNPHQVFGSVTGRTAAGCVVWGARSSGTAVFDVTWVAVGPVSPVV